MRPSRLVLLVVSLCATLLLAGCGSPVRAAPSAAARPSSTPSTGSAAARSAHSGDLPGMPPLLDPRNVYAADRPNLLSPRAAGDRPYVYVPNSRGNTVDVIDQRTYKIVERLRVGRLPQHVVPSYDLRTLWVNDNDGYTLIPIDPRTGRPGRPVPATDPYNLYFTPDGRYAVVMAEKLKEIIFSDPHTMRPIHVLHVPTCSGVNHADFSPNGRYLIATCEFAGRLIKVDVERQRVVGTLSLAAHAMPQDVKVAPDGSLWYVADMQTSGVWLVDGDRFRRVGFEHTGYGAHGLYVNRAATVLYVANRGEGSISLISFATRRVVAKWKLPGHASPDMGNLNAAGTVLWLSGRYDGEVYAISTRDGHLIARIKVGAEPHGLCVWPLPGRYSLGHTGIMR